MESPFKLVTAYRVLDALKLHGLTQRRVRLTGETLYSAVEHDHQPQLLYSAASQCPSIFAP